MNTKLTYGSTNIVRLLVLLVILSVVGVSCSDSDSVTILDDGLATDGTDQPDPVGENPNDGEPLFQVYTETGDSGMRVTYSPASLTVMSNVEELEQIYFGVMQCVGITSAVPPSVLLTTDPTIFSMRADGTEMKGYYDANIDVVAVHADDIDKDLGNKYFWTRHGMIEYLISVHGLSPDSKVSPFLDCHFDK